MSFRKGQVKLSGNAYWKCKAVQVYTLIAIISCIGYIAWRTAGTINNKLRRW